MIVEKVRSKISQINSSLKHSIEGAGRQIISFGIVLTINFPAYHLIWLYMAPQTYENLYLRLSATILCFFLIFQKYWPQKLRSFLPIYWYFTVIYCLPFFFIFMTLKNHASTLWLMNCMSIIFFLMLLFDLWRAIIFFAVGGLAAWYVCILTSADKFTYDPGAMSMAGIIATLLGAYVIGGIFAQNKEIIEKEKLQTMKSLSASIAHELRTPLRAIANGASGIKEYLPVLISGYECAVKNNLIEPSIEPLHYEALVAACNNIESETRSSFTVIKMLLENVKNTLAAENSELKKCSINRCISDTLQRYPFDMGEEKLINWSSTKPDFYFRGDELLITHVLFNLIKNSLYQIKAVGGNIQIWTNLNKSYNELHFKDTAAGIPADILPHIFDRFFTKTQHGTGLGLAFCKIVMENLGGKITCSSKKGEFAEFILYFPVYEEDH